MATRKLIVRTTTGRVILPGRDVLGIVGGPTDGAEYVVLVRWDGGLAQYVTGRVYDHDGDGPAPIREWTSGCYHTDAASAWSCLGARAAGGRCPGGLLSGLVAAADPGYAPSRTPGEFGRRLAGDRACRAALAVILLDARLGPLVAEADPKAATQAFDALLASGIDPSSEVRCALAEAMRRGHEAAAHGIVAATEANARAALAAMDGRSPRIDPDASDEPILGYGRGHDGKNDD